jgi:hypothetical protein
MSFQIEAIESVEIIVRTTDGKRMALKSSDVREVVPTVVHKERNGIWRYIHTDMHITMGMFTITRRRVRHPLRE